MTKYVTVAEVAEMARLSEYTVRQAVREGELPGFKVRGRIRIKADDVRPWIERQPVAKPRPPRRRGLEPGMVDRYIDRPAAATPENVMELMRKAREKSRKSSERNS